MQLRNLNACADADNAGGLADVGEVVFFSELEAEAATDAVTAAACDMLQSG